MSWQQGRDGQTVATIWVPFSSLLTCRLEEKLIDNLLLHQNLQTMTVCKLISLAQLVQSFLETCYVDLVLGADAVSRE